MVKFRFMDLEIWKDSMTLNDQFFDLADVMSDSKNFRIAEQLRAASLSISNNIAEGSGSTSSKDFANYLNYARRSVFETANISIVAHRRLYIEKSKLDQLLRDLDALSRKITNFRRSVIENVSE
jgi:four helix bundle protein